jgi:hypothetical protein
MPGPLGQVAGKVPDSTSWEDGDVRTTSGPLSSRVPVDRAGADAAGARC